MNSPDQASGDGTLAAILRLTDLAAKIERVDHASTTRAAELARDCATAQQQVTGLRDDLGSLDSRADAFDSRLTEVSGLLARISDQIADMAPGEGQPQDNASPDYQVNPAAPWWKPGDQRREDAAARLTDWVDEVYRPAFGYLGGLLAPCWAEHPLCLTYLDALHETWCLLYIPPRDPKTVFAQLDWLTRALLQAAEVMANETKACRDNGSHRPPGQRGAPARFAARPAASR